jgi:hypothetical protein
MNAGHETIVHFMTTGYYGRFEEDAGLQPLTARLRRLHAKRLPRENRSHASSPQR